MQKIFTDEKIVAFRLAVEKSRTISVITHTNPDGDAVGSAGALRRIIKNVYPEKKVKAFTPNDYPDFLKWNAKAAGVEVCKEKYAARKKFLEKCDLIIIADMSTLSRAEHLEESVKANVRASLVLIDHHISPEMPPLVASFHNDEASSTCYIAYCLIKAMGWTDKMDPVCASSLYCGIMTDTGGFSYSYLTDGLFAAAGELVAKGADPIAIHQAVYDNQSENRLRLLGHLINDNMTVIPERRAAFITLNYKEKKKYGYHTGDTEGVVNYPMTISGIITSALFSENDGYIKVSLRSQGKDIDVNAICRKRFNGGGHFNAAGGRYYGTMDETVAAYRAALEEI